MFKDVSKRLTAAALKRNLVASENIEEYIYALNAMLTIAVNIVSALIIGAFMNMVFEVVLYIFVYKFLRKYIGGSHSKTAARCYITSCLTYVTALMAIKYYPFSSLVTIALAIISSVVLWIVCPIEAEKKPLDDIERKTFRHRGHFRILICICCLMIMVYLSQSYYSVVITISMLTVTLFSLERMITLYIKRM